jgi:hypothetical protein
MILKHWKGILMIIIAVLVLDQIDISINWKNSHFYFSDEI